jgi:protocatechuate 3,4-dioxygenase, alpha subunit
VSTKPEGVTPSQTVGPYFAYGLTSQGQYDWNDVQQQSRHPRYVGRSHSRGGPGVRWRRQGDGGDCMLEIWQADAQGRFSDPQDKRAQTNSSFKGFGRIGTNAEGGYAFDTIKPGQVADPDGKMQAPHLSLAVFARGMLLHLYSRIYFEGEAANASDPVLALVPADRRHTLIAKRQSGPGNGVYRFDIHMQGDNETVFFDV